MAGGDGGGGDGVQYRFRLCSSNTITGASGRFDVIIAKYLPRILPTGVRRTRPVVLAHCVNAQRPRRRRQDVRRRCSGRQKNENVVGHWPRIRQDIEKFTQTRVSNNVGRFAASPPPSSTLPLRVGLTPAPPRPTGVAGRDLASMHNGNYWKTNPTCNVRSPLFRPSRNEFVTNDNTPRA